MDLTTMRPDDAALLQQATRMVRDQTGLSVAFGGLRGARSIRVSAVSGAPLRRLTSIDVRPARGLGGLAWVSGQPAVVRDYGRAEGITHDFDAQILGEGIASLAVAPIVVDLQVRGLLYAGSRESGSLDSTMASLTRVASSVAQELRVRDLVDERVQLRMRKAVVDDPAPDLRGALLRIAAETRDPDTARALEELLGSADAAPSSEAELTRRQRDVLALVAYGLTNAQIGARLSLSEVTVKSYLRAIMSRLSVRTRGQAVIEARRLGLLRPSPLDPAS
ncbi:hypothetical protein DVJ78_03535 [Humibacter sp. BT305]|uniref:Uncharacterized protein n=1 Tax=Cnuibacter physcomitrellae TaxID=1619308 RepID=A0A1X9LXQ9_9MICO|nr:LuxR C-terminal-related transcriptional regulator [Cnuibacter physcomitrellae]ARJ06850.1 hypothetical protein B5808_17690 [Cnuibacter physcomitrellae]AXH34612.1 hypothetical protein DVJ78_03535 [Humibacter sp. BT305]GGI38978.1 helix-turn-helix transcriptional regulator [Cnuibacter physcomitrellae]